MTKRNRKILTISLALLVFILAEVIYCRPISLATLGGWGKGPVDRAFVFYQIGHQDTPGSEMEYETGDADYRPDTATDAEREAWEDLISSIRVRRGPFNWMGVLDAPTRSFQFTDGTVAWNLYVICYDKYTVDLQYNTNTGRFLYFAKRMRNSLSCTVLNSEEVCAKMDALIERFGKAQEYTS